MVSHCVVKGEFIGNSLCTTYGASDNHFNQFIYDTTLFREIFFYIVPIGNLYKYEPIR